MTEGSESDGNAIENSSTTITTTISCGQLFGPFSNPLHWLSFKSCDNTCVNNNNPSNELFAKIDIARHSEEQNIKIVYKNGNFYFEAMYDLNKDKRTNEMNETPKLYAWFSNELSVRLPIASSSTINGSTRYFCPLCNQVFMHSNPVVSHMLCTCPKRIQIDSIPPPKDKINSSSLTTIQSSSVSTESAKVTKPHVSKKRGFDIASLVKEESNDSNCSSNKRTKNGEYIKSGESNEFSNSSAFHRPKSPPLIRKSTPISTSSTSIGINSSSMMSAFKKVDQKINSLSNPYDFSNIYQRVGIPSMLPSNTHSVTHPMIPQISIPTSLPTSLSSTSAKSLVSNTLLPYLPPSLAALTFPTSNWCAKCNATFRMTSDLVYHMRSHHKSALSVDPMKKKREEKLRCNICHETFRERHHLTRHMTSHQ